MKHIWTKQELEVYINYCKLNNLKYECIWINMEDDEVKIGIESLHKQMLQIDKPVRIYLNSEYVDTVRYSLIDFVKEQQSDRLLTWIPVNFETGQKMLEFLDNHIQKELTLN